MNFVWGQLIGARQIGQGRFRDFFLHHRVLYYIVSDDAMLGSQEFMYKAIGKEGSHAMHILECGLPNVHPLLSTVGEKSVDEPLWLQTTVEFVA